METLAEQVNVAWQAADSARACIPTGKETARKRHFAEAWQAAHAEAQRLNHLWLGNDHGEPKPAETRRVAPCTCGKCRWNQPNQCGR